MKRGKLIVIDGPDSVGKSTQTQLLAKRLRRLGHKVTIVDFPRYGEQSAGFVEKYLKGKYGKNLGPYIPSVFFAVDRFDALSGMESALAKGEILLSNRYVTANMAHHGGEIANSSLRMKFFKWVMDLEYGIFKLPKPDLNIFLHMPPEVSVVLMNKRKGKTKDILEQNISHQRRAEKTYLTIAQKYKYQVIRSMSGSKLLSPEEIHEKIWQTTKSKLKV